MTDREIAPILAAEIARVSDRPNGSVFYVNKVPDLIGFRDRKYIDDTATQRHRGPGDLMRDAALLKYVDAMDFGKYRILTDAQRKVRVSWPDQVLYVLAQYIYSLQPNPNRRNELTTTGQKVFQRARSRISYAASLHQ